MTTFLSSLGSLGSSRTLRASSSSLQPGLEGGELFLGHGLHFGVGLGEHGLGVGDGLLRLAVGAEGFDRGLQVAVLLGDGLELLLVGEQAGIAELAAEVFIAGFNLVEAVKHGRIQGNR